MYKSVKFVLGLGVLLGLACVFFFRYSYPHNSRQQALLLPQPYGQITFSPFFLGYIGYLSPSISKDHLHSFGYDLTSCQRQQTPQGEPRTQQKVLHRFITDPSYGIVGCEFAPDGNTVLARFSAPSVPTDVYSISVWHRDTGIVQQGPQGLRYIPTSWSPNSKFFAYIAGGDADGREVLDQGDQNQDSPLELRVFDTSTGGTRQVAQQPLLNSIAWMKLDVLLYAKTVQPVPLLFVSPNQAAQPNIYAYSLSGDASKLLITNGYNPASSQDAKTIAYIGWGPASPQKIQNTKQGQSSKTFVSPLTEFGVYLYNTQKKTKILVYPITSKGERDQLLWLPDNKTLLILRIFYHDTNPANNNPNHPVAPGGHGEVHLVKVDTLSKAAKQIAVLTTSDAEARPNPETAFQLKGFAEADNSVFLATSEISQEVNQETGRHNTQDSLYRLNLDDGSKQTLYSGTNLTLLDWHQ